MLEKLYRLDKNDLMKITPKLSFTKHAKKQLLERKKLNVDNPLDMIKINTKIVSSKLAYVNTDNAINIAFSKHTYLVVGQNYNGTYTAITFKEPSHNKYTVKQKYELALKGVER